MNRQECQKAIFNLAVEFGVSPKLITARLLDESDKVDMMEEVLTIEALRAHIGAWKANGMMDYVGKDITYANTSDRSAGTEDICSLAK